MIAVILVGGEGTRLRPLTLDRPKAMLPIGDRPFLAHMLERLATAGVKRVVFSCGYLPDPIVAGFGDMYDGMALEYAVEPEPMDTAGAIRFAIEGRLDDAPFFALNGDVLMEASLGDLMAFHVTRGARATVTLTEVPDPTRYGLVLTDADGRVEAFVEKPEPGAEVTLEPPYWINAGAYVLDRWFLDTVPYMQRVNIEREVFPQLVGNGLYGWRCTGYWNDIGTPESYLAANMHVSGGDTVLARRCVGGRRRDGRPQRHPRGRRDRRRRCRDRLRDRPRCHRRRPARAISDGSIVAAGRGDRRRPVGRPASASSWRFPMAPETMHGQAMALGAQLRAAAPLAQGALRGAGPFRNVALCGLGGSAAGGRLAAALLADQLQVPVEVPVGLTLPGWVGPDTLVVVTSYSGETAEALDWFVEAGERRATRVALGSGGTLAALAETDDVPVVTVEGGYQPRGALGLLLAPLLVLLGEAGAAPDTTDLIARGADAADAAAARDDEARAIAERLAGHVTVLYGSGMRAAIAVRLKNQINENAKVAAFAGAVPEIAHNEILGWLQTPRAVAAARRRLPARLRRVAGGRHAQRRDGPVRRR